MNSKNLKRLRLQKVTIRSLAVRAAIRTGAALPGVGDDPLSDAANSAIGVCVGGSNPPSKPQH